MGVHGVNDGSMPAVVARLHPTPRKPLRRGSPKHREGGVAPVPFTDET
jgi:hypothetical protein